MSQEGYDNLVAELHELESVELPKVREAIAEARDKGDLSENFEYHAAKRAQARLLSRISFKQKVLANARVIDMSRLSAGGDDQPRIGQENDLHHSKSARGRYPRR